MPRFHGSLACAESTAAASRRSIAPTRSVLNRCALDFRLMTDDSILTTWINCPGLVALHHRPFFFASTVTASLTPPATPAVNVCSPSREPSIHLVFATPCASVATFVGEAEPDEAWKVTT